MSAYRPLNIQGMRWALMSEIDASEAFASVDALKMRMMLLLAILLVSIIGISFLFAKTMTRPIKVLTAKAESLAKGDLGVDISVSGGDEISHLARSFDMMRNALREMIEGLEDKVRERTSELEESKQKISVQLAFQSALLNAIPNPIFVKGVDTRFTACNTAYEKAFAIDQKEILGKSILDSEFMPEGVRSAQQEADQQLIKEGGFTQEEQTFTYADGSEHHIMYWRRTFTLDDEEPGGMIGVLIDISQRKQAEIAVQAA